MNPENALSKIDFLSVVIKITQPEQIFSLSSGSGTQFPLSSHMAIIVRLSGHQNVSNDPSKVELYTILLETGAPQSAVRLCVWPLY